MVGMMRGNRRNVASCCAAQTRMTDNNLSMALNISSTELLHILRTPRDQISTAGSVLLDCRPFLEFSRAHIVDSRNVNWNSMMRRRSKSSLVALEWLIPDKALLARLRRGDYSPVVVVDERSRCVSEVKSDSVAHMLLTALQNEVHTRICFLCPGGFEGFSATSPELCYTCASSHSSIVEPEPALMGQRTPAYDRVRKECLFLGSAVHSSRREALAAAGITAVLNVSSSCPNLYEEEFEYLQLTVEDSLAADIRAYFSTAIAFIDTVKQSGGRVLVHCQAGISRSATICLAYLMHTQRVRLDEAFDFVKQRRHVISPNLAFMGQLLQFETDVLC